jgi:drug/metabolite transporter (DMT)-like permease
MTLEETPDILPRMQWLLPLGLLIAFEFIADIFAKEWSLRRSIFLAVGALASYMIANTFWLFALKNGSGLARGAVLFSVGSGVVALLLGILFYKEELTRLQIIGLILGLISLACIFWND